VFGRTHSSGSQSPSERKENEVPRRPEFTGSTSFGRCGRHVAAVPERDGSLASLARRSRRTGAVRRAVGPSSSRDKSRYLGRDLHNEMSTNGEETET
jgi:hypothetical protein